jgi:hypothetical protein
MIINNGIENGPKENFDSAYCCSVHERTSLDVLLCGDFSQRWQLFCIEGSARLLHLRSFRVMYRCELIPMVVIKCKFVA